MKEFIKPDWENSILNVSATFAKFLGVENKNKTLPLLENELAKEYKNVVFICCDGLGASVIEKHLTKNDFLRKNIKQTLTSTFPSTTTNATTTLGLNKYPLEHGWLGWTVHFEAVNKNIDLYPHYFGKGDYGYWLGNYIAVGTSTNKQFLPYENSPRLKGHHCSLTKTEMTVPLIILSKK